MPIATAQGEGVGSLDHGICRLAPHSQAGSTRGVFDGEFAAAQLRASNSGFTRAYPAESMAIATELTCSLETSWIERSARTLPHRSNPLANSLSPTSWATSRSARNFRAASTVLGEPLDGSGASKPASLTISAVLERDVEPLVDADHAPCPGRRATVRMDEGAGPERQAGDYKTQCKPRARTHNLFAKAMRKAEIHANGFARSRRLRPAMAWAA